MGFRRGIVFIFAVVGSCLAFTAEYVPKSYYVIHQNGDRSPTIFLRDKRSLQDLIPLVRMRRSDSGSSGGGSYSSSGSFAGSSAGGVGSGGDNVHFADNLAAGLEAVKKLSGYPGGFPGGFPGGNAGGQAYGAASGGYPSGSGNAGGYGDAGGYGGAGGYGNGLSGPDLHSRFGGDEGTSYSGSAEGARGVYSASSSSIDGDGNVKYSVKTGKF